MLPSGLRHFCCSNDLQDWNRIAWDGEPVLEQFRE
jgi:hypothetical protein